MTYWALETEERAAKKDQNWEKSRKPGRFQVLLETLIDLTDRAILVGSYIKIAPGGAYIAYRVSISLIDNTYFLWVYKCMLFILLIAAIFTGLFLLMSGDEFLRCEQCGEKTLEDYGYRLRECTKCGHKQY